ncbi:RNase H family protein [Nodosilinea sp. FACHB-141]|uniref:RNase H type-1 domain-containing protein n=1 Tax=Leptolyngbya subtilissima DQ-A4 TaxID=2933933 RepID=A0ABV0K9U0_9CYAN|nr:RNase H family protein [Nodosilinea sp. FACHB-141]
MKGWAVRWRSKGWKRTQTKSPVNADLWQQLLSLCEQHQVEFQWVKGHSGNVENERCDRLAVAAAKQLNLPIDEGYEVPQVLQQESLF